MPDLLCHAQWPLLNSVKLSQMLSWQCVSLMTGLEDAVLKVLQVCLRPLTHSLYHQITCFNELRMAV